MTTDAINKKTAKTLKKLALEGRIPVQIVIPDYALTGTHRGVPRRGPAKVWLDIAKILRDHPRSWLMLDADFVPTTTPTAINGGLLHAFRPTGHYQAFSRVLAQGTPATVFARYVSEVPGIQRGAIIDLDGLPENTHVATRTAEDFR